MNDIVLGWLHIWRETPSDYDDSERFARDVEQRGSLRYSCQRDRDLHLERRDRTIGGFLTFPMPWADYFSLLVQFLIGSIAVSIAADMVLTVITNKLIAYKGNKTN